MANEKFLDELKTQYEKEFELKTTLETKANYNLVSAGVVVGLLFGFGATVLDGIDVVPNISLVLSSLLVGIILFVASILFSVLALRIKVYYYASTHEHFYNEEGMLDEEVINEFRNMDTDKFLDDRIHTYLRANKSNSVENDYKASKVNVAHWLFVFAIITVPITVLIFIFSTIPK